MAKEKKSVLEEFHPPTHSEIVGEKPLREVVGGKWTYELRLMKAMTFFKFWIAKNKIIRAMEEEVEKAGKTETEKGTSGSRIILFFHFLKALNLLWDLGEKPKNLFTRMRFKIFFFRYYLDHLDEALVLFERALAQNGRIFFLLQSLKNFDLVQTKPYAEGTGPETFSVTATLIKERGSLFSPNAS